MKFWIAAHLPLLSLEALCPPQPDSAAAQVQVVIDGDGVLTVSSAAATLGLMPGMRRASVLALHADAQILERDPLREKAALDSIALALLQFTPCLAPGDEDSLLLEVSTCLRLFGGHRALLRRVARCISHLGFSVRLGSAPTARGAWLLARQMPNARRRQRRFAIQPTTLQRRVDALPCLLLPAARSHADWLAGIGCKRLGTLRRLPRAGLRRRTDATLLAALDAAYGDANESLRWIEAPPHFDTRLELMERIEQADAVLFAARRLALQLIGWLAARQLAMSGVALYLEHERGRAARLPTVLEIGLAEPDWHEDHLLHLLKERLARCVLPAPVVALRLEAKDLAAKQAPTASLFPEPGGTTADFRRLIELLSARLGVERVRIAAPQADHRPEVGNAWQPALTAGAVKAAPTGLASDSRPFWLLRQPLALRMEGLRPFHGSPLRLLAGPERIESGWWDGGLMARDYFVAQGDDAACYWVYRERGGDSPRWFLHGLFG